MIERWLQITCNGCGETETHHTPNVTVRELREYHRAYGWAVRKGFDYCPTCLANGVAKIGVTDFTG